MLIDTAVKVKKADTAANRVNIFSIANENRKILKTAYITSKANFNCELYSSDDCALT
jgi:hypothetical protein